MIGLRIKTNKALHHQFAYDSYYKRQSLDLQLIIVVASANTRQLRHLTTTYNKIHFRILSHTIVQNVRKLSCVVGSSTFPRIHFYYFCNSFSKSD